MSDSPKGKMGFGCALCRKLNDGLCNNYCSMDKQSRKKVMQSCKHLFRIELTVPLRNIMPSKFCSKCLVALNTADYRYLLVVHINAGGKSLHEATELLLNSEVECKLCTTIQLPQSPKLITSGLSALG